MPVPRGTIFRVKTYPSGKKVRLAIAPSGRIVEAKPINSAKKVGKTKTGRRLSERRRRVGH